jgi:hypothetical protein
MLVGVSHCYLIYDTGRKCKEMYPSVICPFTLAQAYKFSFTGFYSRVYGLVAIARAHTVTVIDCLVRILFQMAFIAHKYSTTAAEFV